MRGAAVAIFLVSVFLSGCGDPGGQKGGPLPQAEAVVIAAAGELTQTHPVPGFPDLYAILQRDGVMWIYREGETQAHSVLDMRGKVSYAHAENEYGLKTFAFHPDFATNGMVFLGYTDAEQHVVLGRFFADPDDPAKPWTSGDSLFRGEYTSTPFHNFAEIQFGPDGYLYVTLGDPSRVPGAQFLDTFYGKMLRLDVDGQSGYEVPSDNPFVGDAEARPEIWLYGLRNPWRFDIAENGDIYIADTGQGRMEEVSIYRANGSTSRNFGWPWYEGTLRYRGDTSPDAPYYSPTAEPSEELTWPVAEYSHEDGCAIVGGALYEGDEFPEIKGEFVVAEHCFGELRVLRSTDDGWKLEDWLSIRGDRINSIDEDRDGELLVASRAGRMYRVVPS